MAKRRFTNGKKTESTLWILPNAIKYLALCRLVFQKLELGLSVRYLCTIDAVVQLLLAPTFTPTPVSPSPCRGSGGGGGKGEGDKEFVSGREKHCLIPQPQK